MTPEYLAGFFDGEGCVRMESNGQGRSYLPVLNISQKDRRPLDLIAERFGGQIYRRPNGVHSWQLMGWKRTIPVLRFIAPHCIVKSEQVYAVLGFYAGWSERLGKGSDLGADKQMALAELAKRLSEMKHVA